MIFLRQWHLNCISLVIGKYGLRQQSKLHWNGWIREILRTAIELNPVNTGRSGCCAGPLNQSNSFMWQSLWVDLYFKGQNCCKNKILGQHLTMVNVSYTIWNHNTVWLLTSYVHTGQKGGVVTVASSLETWEEQTIITVQIYITFIHFKVSWSSSKVISK